MRSLDHVRFGMWVIRAGWRVSFAIAMGTLIYLAFVPDQPHRLVIAVIAVAALLEAVAIWRFVDLARVAASPAMPWWMFAWNVTHAAAAALVAGLDGGIASPFVTILFVCATFAALTLPRGLLLAVMAFLGLAMSVVAVTGGQVEQLLVYIPCMVAIALLSGAIAGELHARVSRAEAAELETIEKLARAVEFRDASTGGHIDRMARYARRIAEQLGLSAADCDLIHRAGPLHDVGKIGVPDSILLKPGPLTLEERAVMERHAQAGHDLLTGSRNVVLELGAVIALSHHERWDGMGYPQGLRGEEIPLPARIVAVADVFDALTTDRVYRDAMSPDEALALIRAGRGTQFDPVVVNALLSVLARETPPTGSTAAASPVSLV